MKNKSLWIVVIATAMVVSGCGKNEIWSEVKDLLSRITISIIPNDDDGSQVLLTYDRLNQNEETLEYEIVSHLGLMVEPASCKEELLKLQSKLGLMLKIEGVNSIEADGPPSPPVKHLDLLHNAGSDYQIEYDNAVVAVMSLSPEALDYIHNKESRISLELYDKEDPASIVNSMPVQIAGRDKSKDLGIALNALRTILTIDFEMEEIKNNNIYYFSKTFTSAEFGEECYSFYFARPAEFGVNCESTVDVKGLGGKSQSITVPFATSGLYILNDPENGPLDLAVYFVKRQL
ncbi:MAG: hypothetical protein Q4G10_05550 [Bacteroidia bacterium]|nr:hypothetical protein [Bacteroidia bacterium]